MVIRFAIWDQITGTCSCFVKTDPLAVSESCPPPDSWRVLNVEDWAEIRRLHRAGGVPIKVISLRGQRASRGSVVDPFEPQIRSC